jgi:NodT family efflux transporter outer membrane factor (OMF) lipoprotein
MAICRRLVLLVLVSALAGCVSLPGNDTVSAAAERLPTEWRSGQDAQATDVTAWWNSFSDEQLRALIDKALANNYDLKAAVERSRQAQALVTAARSNLYPELDADSSVSRARTHLPPPAGRVDQSAVGVSGSWDVDVFGGNQLAALAAVAQASATDEARRDFEVALTASVASSYVQLRGLQRQLAIVNGNIAARTDTLHLTRVRYEAGLATDLDVSQAETQLRQVEAAVPDLERRIDNELGALTILTGTPPEFVDNALVASAPIPSGTPSLPDQAPAELLERRPDLREAARRIDVASANLGSAQTDLLPKFSLSFAGSVDHLAFHELPGVTDNLFNIGLGVFWPLFNGGRIHANIAAHDAALREAQYAFDQALLNALQDVESAYTDVRAHRECSMLLHLAVESAQRSSQLAEDLYHAGRADFLSVLAAHTQVLDTERELAQAQTDVAVSTVSLYRALGGGWRATP